MPMLLLPAPNLPASRALQLEPDRLRFTQVIFPAFFPTYQMLMKTTPSKQFRRVLMAALTASATFGFIPVETAHAAAPFAKTSAPGYYRMMLGDFEVTALSDGTVDLPVDKLLTNTTPAKVKKALAKSFLTVPVETSVNAYLINTGSKLVLIDTGAAKLFGPTLGKLLANL